MTDRTPHVDVSERQRARQEFARTHVRGDSRQRRRVAQIIRGAQRRLSSAGRELVRPTASTPPSDRTEWAPIAFHNSTQPEVPAYVDDHVARVYERQADDTKRFAHALPGLLARLDASRATTIAMNCDSRFVPLFENWAASCTRAQIDVRESTLVFATDAEAKRRVEALGYVAYLDRDSELLAGMTESAEYGDNAWSQYMYHQNWVIKQLLTLDTDVLFQDVDLVWMRNPIDVLRRQADHGADIQAMYDGPNHRFQPLYANSGFMYFRPNDRVRSFWDHAYAEHRWVGYYRSQQEPLNVLLAAYAHRGLSVHILDEEIFANGHRYNGERPAPAHPWVVHNSWTTTLEEKLERYRKFDLWFLD